MGSNQNLRLLVELVNKKMKSSGSIVYLEEDGRVFDIKLDLGRDPFLQGNVYEKGNAIIYINDRLYDFIDTVARSLKAEVHWNNSRTTGWVIAPNY